MDDPRSQEGTQPPTSRKERVTTVLAFIAETKEYLAGNFRRGETISGQEVARFILSFKKLIPGCVRQVIIRADAEFYSWVAVNACLRRGYDFIISSRGRILLSIPRVGIVWVEIRTFNITTVYFNR